MKIIALLLMLSSSASPASKSCLENGPSEQLLLQAKQILSDQKIEFRAFGEDKLQIAPDNKGTYLNLYASEVQSKYNAKVLVSPPDLVCGAGADTDPSDACNLTVNLGIQSLLNGGLSTTPVHEGKHLEQVAPFTNAGFDSLFFGRISNLDGTDHSFYPSFALDEISAYSAELVWLKSNQQKFSPESFAAFESSGRAQLNALVPRAIDVVQRYLKFLSGLQGNVKSYSVINSNGDIAIADLKNENEPSILIKNGDWRGAGTANMVALVDGQNQLTVPLFDSRLNITRTANMIGKKKITAWSMAPVAAELKQVTKRLELMRSTLKDAKKALDSSDYFSLEKVMRGGEHFKNLGRSVSPCKVVGKPTSTDPPSTATK